MKLVYPSKKYLKSYRDAFIEYKENNVTHYFFDDENEVDIVKKYYNYRNNIGLTEDRVPQTTYWLIDKGEFVGEISIRHKLNDMLKKYGGHIGYGIRYSKWNQGYGTKMLALALKKAKQMGFDKVMVTCDHDNIGSTKVIENNNGKFQDIVEHERNGKKILTKRYWISLE